ncbi:hypothetical protein KIU27_003832, partial [Escherichia coli]|nr:hypothetical protein [Escherichia coli]
AAGIQQRAATNMLIKPLVVSIIRQRPVMEYEASHLGNMVNRLEEALPPGVTGITAILRLLRFIT